MEQSKELNKEKTSVEESKKRSYEYGLPGYLQKDLDAYKEGLANGST